MIPPTIILGTIRVPTIIPDNKGDNTFVICAGPFAMTMKGEFYRDQAWGAIDSPLDGTPSRSVKCRTYGDHYFLYRTTWGRGRRGGNAWKRGQTEYIQKAFDEFMESCKDAVAA